MATDGDSIAIIGGRRMGKTSLLEAIARALEKRHTDSINDIWAVVAHVDLSGEMASSISYLFRLFLEQIQDNLRFYMRVPDLEFMPRDDQPPAPVFRKCIETLAQSFQTQLHSQLRIIVLLDECEQIVIQSWAPSLYGALRYLLNGYNTRFIFKVVMTGAHQFLTQVRQAGSPLRNILTYHTLCTLDEQAIHNLIVRPTSGLLSTQVEREVIEQSGGHPFLAQYIMHGLWEYGLASATPRIVNQVVANFLRERNDFHDWAIGLGKSSLEIYEILLRSSEAPTEEDIQAALRTPMANLPQLLNALSYHGLVKLDSERGTYRVTNRDLPPV